MLKFESGGCGLRKTTPGVDFKANNFIRFPLFGPADTFRKLSTFEINKSKERDHMLQSLVLDLCNLMVKSFEILQITLKLQIYLPNIMCIKFLFTINMFH